jgi:hypothetical protein
VRGRLPEVRTLRLAAGGDLAALALPSAARRLLAEVEAAAEG